MEKKETKSKTKIDAKSIIEELKTPGLIILGMVGGNYAGKFIDQMVKVDATATGFQAKALIKPIVQITTGVGGALFLKDKNLKLIASGVAAGGIAATVKVFLKKDILEGLASFAGLGNTTPTDKKNYNQVFHEPINLQIEAYNPNLPELDGQIAALPIETETVINGTEDELLGEYEQIKEVQIL
jgi:hypothetical protein